MQTKIGLISLGCAKNLVDSEHMLARLREAGYTIVDALETAEVVIINTCGFIEAAKEEAIAAILETAQRNREVKRAYSYWLPCAALPCRD